MFDEVVVAVGINIDKRGFFSNDKKVDIIRQATAGMEGVRIIHYDKLTIELTSNGTITPEDANRRLAPEIETIIIPTAQDYAHISSTAVRDILKHGGDTSLFVPEGVTL